MGVLHLRILPVFSQYYSDRQIGDMQLLKHQVETLEAFRDPNVDVIFNTAMTGDGKSLAALLPTFLDDKHVVAMYPTNELIRDQCSALSGYRQDLARRLPTYDTMYSAKITELMRIHDILERL